MCYAMPGKLPRRFHRRLWLLVLSKNLLNKRVGHAVKDYRRRIRGNTPDMGLPGIVFCGCDDVDYKKNARNFLLSAEELSESLNIHLHLYGPSQEVLDDIDEIRRTLRFVALSFTWEDDSYRKLSLPEPVYCSGARFIVLHHLLLACLAPILCIDIGSIVHRSLGNSFELIGKADVTLEIGLGGRRQTASAVAVSHTKEALGFCEKLAASIWAALQMRPGDRIDQPILHYLHVIRRRIKRRIRWQQMPAHLVDHECGDGSVIWLPMGARRDEDLVLSADAVFAASARLDVERADIT